MIKYSMVVIIGTEASRRQREINRLNAEYQGMVDITQNIETIYHFLVETENYRMLSQFEFDKKETPIRSARLSVPLPLTDVIILSIINSTYLSPYIIISFLLFIYRPSPNQGPTTKRMNFAMNLEIFHK